MHSNNWHFYEHVDYEYDLIIKIISVRVDIALLKQPTSFNSLEI